MPTMPSRPSSGAVAPQHSASRSTVDADVAEALSEPAPAAAPRRPGPRAGRPRIVVKGTAPSDTTPASAVVPVPLEYPVQLSKVQAPPLREDTLARDRLLDWLSVKIHSRVVLLVAEAGYGKTTLLADFSRRTRIRTLWFRLDRGDRDWMGFIAHLIAAVRVHMPGFGSATAGMLRNASTSATSLDAVLDTFLRELTSLPNDPTSLVFDDVHLVDDSPDVKQILGELLARGPERMSFVFASRREPPVRLARLRALVEVAELRTNDLRFDASETDRLFRETYEIPLEPAVLAELNRRTEGWAASLQLVRAAIHARNPAQVRAFVSSMSGAEGHLYEYLAEEVVGDLPDHLQRFLMQTSVLETVDLTVGPAAAGVTEAETRSLIAQAEGYGLFGKSSPGTRYLVRAHPLVRDFLAARLRRAIGLPGVQAIHLRVARAADPEDWQCAARHYLAAGLEKDARQVLTKSVEQILAKGQYAAAEELWSAFEGGPLGGAPGLILQSRIAQQRAAMDEALDLAERARDLEPDAAAVLVTLSTARALAGNVSGALTAARQLGASAHADWAAIGSTFEQVLQTSLAGSLQAAENALVELADGLKGRAAGHYRGVALLNLSLARTARGDFRAAVARAEEAITDLESSSAGVELASARTAHAVALTFLGEMSVAREEFAEVVRTVLPGQLLEIAAEVGEAEALVGESMRGWPLIHRVAEELESSHRGEEARFSRAMLHLHEGNLPAAHQDISAFRHGKAVGSAAFDAKRYLAEGLLVALQGGGLSPAAIEGSRIAAEQRADLWAQVGRTLACLAEEARDPSAGVMECSAELPVVLSILAELVLKRFSDLSADAVQVVAAEASHRPWRWRGAVRRRMTHADGRELLRLAELLELIGESEDVRRLSDTGRRLRDKRGPRLGYMLARRLADHVFVEDLGRLRITVGGRAIEGVEIRRKVLALLCLLLSRPRFASTREEVLDSLWPEHDPTSALNSLNQTVYFLRRVFEPDFRDDTSPGYVGQDGETIWLDNDLVDCRSRRCLELIRAMPGEPTAEGSVALAREYLGRFALDFAYEEWSAPYRDALHAGYLRIVESAVRGDLDSGHLGRGIFIAERATEVDPDAEEIQVALVRLYRYSGAHAAAAEQYAHYARYMNELGLEPPALGDL